MSNIVGKVWPNDERIKRPYIEPTETDLKRLSEPLINVTEPKKGSVTLRVEEIDGYYPVVVSDGKLKLFFKSEEENIWQKTLMRRLIKPLYWLGTKTMRCYRMVNVKRLLVVKIPNYLRSLGRITKKFKKK